MSKYLPHIFCGPGTCSLPLDSPKGPSCQQLLFYYFCLSFLRFSTTHSLHAKFLKYRWFIIMPLFSCLCFQVCHQVSRLPWQQIGMSCWHCTLVLPHVNDVFTPIQNPDFTGKLVSGGKWGRTSVCVWRVDWPWAVPVQGLGRRRDGFSKWDAV